MVKTRSLSYGETRHHVFRMCLSSSQWRRSHMVCKQFKNSDYKKGDELNNCYTSKKFYSGNLTKAQREIFVTIRHYPLCMNNIKSPQSHYDSLRLLTQKYKWPLLHAYVQPVCNSHRSVTFQTQQILWSVSGGSVSLSQSCCVLCSLLIKK